MARYSDVARRDSRIDVERKKGEGLKGPFLKIKTQEALEASCVF